MKSQHTVNETHRILSKIKRAGLVLGVGMGGFLDGIALHRVLRLHDMVSARYPPDTIENVHVNMLWDGIFDLACWLVTLLGIAKLWNVVETVGPAALFNGTVFWGSMVMGWGLFNLVEGLINHRLLEIHHFIDEESSSTATKLDYLYILGAGGLPVLVSHLIVRRGEMRIWEEEREMRPLVAPGVSGSGRNAFQYEGGGAKLYGGGSTSTSTTTTTNPATWKAPVPSVTA